MSLLISSMWGCRDREAKVREYEGKVQGRVWMGEQPLSHGSLCFIPEVAEEAGGRPNLATIDTDGCYVVGNAHPSKPIGLKAGRYRVTVMAYAMPADNTPLIFQLAVPEYYTDWQRTPFVVHIKPGDNQFDLHLTPFTNFHKSQTSLE